MNSLEPKKLAIIRILQILHKHSDADHPLTQDEIATYLLNDYGIELERKAIGKNIAILRDYFCDDNDVDIDIVSDKHGSYMLSRPFEDSELRMLIDGVLASRHITANHSKKLIEKLCNLSNKYFRSHVKNIYSVNDWSKTDNAALFLNIDIIDGAIEEGKKVAFVYNKYGEDKKLHKSSDNVASPYQLILHNQRYYLMACNEKWGNMTYYRLDRITDMRLLDEPATPLRSVEGYASGINYKEIATSLPYMFTDKPEHVEFLCEGWVLDHAVDWFGDNARISRQGERYKVSVRVSPMAMEYWAMQYLNAVEITFPQSLRQKIASNLHAAIEKYN